MENKYAVFEQMGGDNWEQWTTWLCEEDAIYMKKTLSLRFTSRTFFLLKREG